MTSIVTRTLSCGGKKTLLLAGHSRSSESTFFFAKLNAGQFSFRAALDVGNVNKDFDNWYGHTFLTHGHADHSAYLMAVQKAYYTPSGEEAKAQLFVPAEISTYVDKYIHALQELNDGMEIPFEEFYRTADHEVVSVAPGQSFEFENGRLVCDILQAHHSVPCVCYAFSTRTKKLKEEYSDLPGRELGALRKSGVEISNWVQEPVFVFCGDTTIEFFSTNSEILDREGGFPLIIVECTYVGDEVSEADATERGHIHWNQLRPFVEKYSETQFVLIHFSMRYSDEFLKQFFAETGLSNVFPWTDDSESE